MPGVLFWNVQKKSVAAELVWLADEYEVDVIALAECTMNSVALVQQLNQGALGGFSEIVTASPGKIAWFSRLPAGSVVPRMDGAGASVLNVSMPSGQSIILAGVHLPSKINEGDLEQLHSAQLVKKALSEVSGADRVSKILVIGDFNMNPFDPGMCAVTGFHAVMDRNVAKRKPTKFKGSTYERFYNPMWSRLGDGSAGPPGTHWYSKALVRFYWNTYDQVLLSPGLLDDVADSAISVIDLLNATTLAGSGVKWKCKSDHLPIHVRI